MHDDGIHLKAFQIVSREGILTQIDMRALAGLRVLARPAPQDPGIAGKIQARRTGSGLNGNNRNNPSEDSKTGTALYRICTDSMPVFMSFSPGSHAGQEKSPSIVYRNSGSVVTGSFGGFWSSGPLRSSGSCRSSVSSKPDPEALCRPSSVLSSGSADPNSRGL